MRQAMLSVPHVFLPDSLSSEKSARRHYAVKEGDHLTLLNVYNGFEVVCFSRLAFDMPESLSLHTCAQTF
jgi:hypothetical protein